MNNRLHTYFDRTRVGRRDYFRQLIFLTFAPISIILFSLHLFGSYGLTNKPALACSACYVECYGLPGLYELDKEVKAPSLLALAVRFGKTRLIDNIILE